MVDVKNVGEKLFIGKMAQPQELKGNKDADKYPLVEWKVEGESVVNPYSQRIIRVKHIPRGALVTDPAYPISQKKFLGLQSNFTSYALR